MSNVYHDKYNKKRPVIHFRTSQKMKNKLKQYAKNADLKLANFIKLLIESWVKEHETENQD